MNLLHPVPELLHLPQTDRSGDPPKADQLSDLLPHPYNIASHIQACDAPLQRLSAPRITVALKDAPNDVLDVAIMFFFHSDRELALALALGAGFADYDAAKDFDFGDVV